MAPNPWVVYRERRNSLYYKRERTLLFDIFFLILMLEGRFRVASLPITIFLGSGMLRIGPRSFVLCRMNASDVVCFLKFFCLRNRGCDEPATSVGSSRQ